MPVLLVFLLPLPDGFRKGKQSLENQSLDNLSFSIAQLKFFKLLLEFLCLLCQSRLKGAKWISRHCLRPWQELDPTPVPAGRIKLPVNGLFSFGKTFLGAWMGGVSLAVAQAVPVLIPQPIWGGSGMGPSPF